LTWKTISAIMAISKRKENNLSGTKAGAAKAAKTMVERYGADFYKNMGRAGGRAKVSTKGFGGMTPEKRRAAGQKGGTISRRGPVRKETYAENQD